MKHIQKLVSTFQGFTCTIRRFPVTFLLFLLSAIYTSYNIYKGFLDNYMEVIYAFVLGAAVYIVLQLLYERFIDSKIIRILFFVLAVLSSLIYYIVLNFTAVDFTIVTMIRTNVLFFILFIAFIWVPSIKSEIGFSDSFMAVFKGAFIVAFYSGVMFLGIAIILAAIDMLFMDIDIDAYLHVLNIIGSIYAPIHFLSLIPVYPAIDDNNDITEDEGKIGENDNDKIKTELSYRIKKAIEPSKFLEGLISYIIIPVTAVFTIILLLYIILNITGEFWKNNLLEPLLVTYSITVIVVYLLASEVKGKLALYFRMVFPKILIPVVLLQTIASIIKIGELGITVGRYYVIMFGIFATISAIIFSIRPNHKTNVIAPILIILSIISILPPVDAFLISKKNQIGRLTKVLNKNDMLMGDRVIPNTDIPYEDREIIVDTIQYLNRMNYTKDVSFLKKYSLSQDFDATFGFPMYDSAIKDPVVFSLYLPKGIPVDISGYDFLLEVELYGQEDKEKTVVNLWDDGNYSLIHEAGNGIGSLLLMDNQGNELIRYSLDNIYAGLEGRTDKVGELTPDEARFIIENEYAVICIITKAVHYEVWDNGGSYQNIEAFIMAKIK